MDLIVAHHQQNAIADLGDLRSINDHAHRSRIHDHVIVLLCQSIQQVLKPLRAQQRDGIQQFVAHRDKVHARNVGVEQDFLLFGNAGQLVRQALLFGTRRKLHPKTVVSMLRRRSVSTRTTRLPRSASFRHSVMLVKLLPSDAWELVSMIFLISRPKKETLVERVLKASLTG